MTTACVDGDAAPAYRGDGTRPGDRSRSKARVERVTDAIAEQIDADHEHEDDRARNRRNKRRVEQEFATLAEHGAEIGLRRLRAQAEEAEARCLKDHPADRRRHGDDDDRRDIGQNLRDQDRKVAFSGQAGCIDELPVNDSQRGAPQIARKKGNVDHSDGDHRVEEARSEGRNNRERQEHIGKRHEHIDRAHQQSVNPPAKIAGANDRSMNRQARPQKWPSSRRRGSGARPTGDAPGCRGQADRFRECDPQ